MILQKEVYLFLLLFCEMIKLQPASPIHHIVHERRPLAIVLLVVIDRTARYFGNVKGLSGEKNVYHLMCFSDRTPLIHRT